MLLTSTLAAPSTSAPFGVRRLQKADPGEVPQERPMIEVKADGLAYETGADQPLTGKVIQYLPKSAHLLR